MKEEARDANTFPWLAQATERVARAVPDGRFLSLTGQDHGVLHQPWRWLQFAS